MPDAAPFCPSLPSSPRLERRSRLAGRSRLRSRRAAFSRSMHATRSRSWRAVPSHSMRAMPSRSMRARRSPPIAPRDRACVRRLAAEASTRSMAAAKSSDAPLRAGSSTGAHARAARGGGRFLSRVAGPVAHWCSCVLAAWSSPCYPGLGFQAWLVARRFAPGPASAESSSSETSGRGPPGPRSSCTMRASSRRSGVQ